MSNTSYKYYDDLSGAESSCDDDDDDDVSVSDIDDCNNGSFGAYHSRKNLHESYESCHHKYNHERNKRKNDDEVTVKSSKSVSRTNQESTDYNKRYNDNKKKFHNRFILHLDVDCFYCQCECIRRQIDYSNVPMAIGQKHIIVTCNYAARQQLGIQKLMSRKLAQELHPHLIIIDGSDLQYFRQYSVKIYNSFRTAIKKKCTDTAVCKGSMDEMMADITTMIMNMNYKCNENNVVEERHSQALELDKMLEKNIYIYGEQKECTIMMEDQSGVSSTVVYDPNLQSEKKIRSVNACSLHNQLRISADFAKYVQEYIYQDTGFTTTIGVSTNILLSKIASGLKKPGSVNVLFPSYSEMLIKNMPLRKIPGVGSRTMKSLAPCLEEFYNSQNKKDIELATKPVWTCGDLLKVPRNYVMECIHKLSSISEKNAYEYCDIVLKKCSGIDDTTILDDHGMLSKTLSVEDSFRRGTIIREADVLRSIEILYNRLIQLYNNRLEQQKYNKNHHDCPLDTVEYPTIIKLTVRFLSPEEPVLSAFKQPTVLKSQQSKFDGYQFLKQSNEQQKQLHHLRLSFTPLLKSLVFTGNTSINITRMNIALTNFRTLPGSRTTNNNNHPFGISSSQSCSSSMNIMSSMVMKDDDISDSNPNNRKNNVQESPKKRMRPSQTITNKPVVLDGQVIDMQVLSELPPDIVAEIQRECQQQKGHELRQHLPSKTLKTSKMNKNRRSSQEGVTPRGSTKTLHDYFQSSK